MHRNLSSARQNVVSHAANANHAVLCGHSADRIVTATKRLLGRKRFSSPASYQPETSGSGSMRMPECLGPWCSQLGTQPALRTFPGSGVRPSTTGETPAPIWATLIITRALSS